MKIKNYNSARHLAANFYLFFITELGIALLEGGNQDIQQTLFTALHSGDTSQNFFKVFHEKMSEAQMEIKSSVTVNTSDIAAKANEEKDLSNKELDKALKKRNAKPANGVILTEHLKEELDDALTSTQQVNNSLSFLYTRWSFILCKSRVFRAQK